ncbi:MAG: Mur ligase [Proteobacteria bacterium]|nr:Mur ligase [Pseudomonadota bacterium]
MTIPFEDSRRLTGANLYFPVPGAVLDTAPGIFVDDAAVERWRANIDRLRRELDWPEIETATRLRDGTGSLAITAPIDQLFTATEVNELALEQAQLPFSSAGRKDFFHAPAYPAIWDPELALHTLQRASVAERQPRLVALLDEAHRRDLPPVLDDTELTLGAGNGARTWPLDALPSISAVDWPSLHGIPVALVTGSNGKTTTTRLVAAISERAERCTAFSSTDGVVIGGELVAAGDYSGPAGARTALRDARSEAAVLETARGGILRRGLAVERVQAAIVTNISADHFGEYGVHDLDDLADAKLVVAHALRADGTLVLNADDEVLVRKSRQSGFAIRESEKAKRLAWFALDADHPRLIEHRARGGMTCGVSDGKLLLHADGIDRSLGRIADMPLSANGAAKYNIANLAGAALLAHALGIDDADIAQVCAAFGARNSDNPGRLMRWRFGATTVIVDYAHNPDGLRGLLEVARSLHPQGRLALVLGQAGNREDADIRELAAVAARNCPDFVVLKELASYARGRALGEVVALLRAELAREGVAENAMTLRDNEIDAARGALAWARDGDLLVLPIHDKQGRADVVALLDKLAATEWEPGLALPARNPA